MRICFSLILFLNTIFAFGNSSSDSLTNVLKKTTDKEDRFKILTELVSANLYSDKDLAVKYLEEAESISTETQKPVMLARINLLHGRVLETEGNYSKALSYFIKSQKQFESVKDNKGISQTLNSIGIMHWYSGDYEKAIQYFDEGYELNKKIGDKEGMSTAKVNTAIVYDDQGKYEEALKLYEETLIIFQELKDDWSIAACYNNMGITYTATKKFDQAFDSYNKALEINRKLKDKSGIASALNNIGFNFVQRGKYSQAIPYLQESLKISEAEKFLYDKKLALLNLSLSYNGLGQFKNAFEFHRKYSSVKDSILNSESKKNMQELETKYSTEKKSLEIKNLKKEQELTQQNQLEKDAKEEAEQKTKNTILFSIIGVILISSILFYLRYLQKKKDNLILQDKNQKISQQKNIIEEKNKDITDSIQYAKTIQESILPDMEILNSFFSESFVLFMPRDIVSGDFYWFTRLEDKIIFTVGDCTGHGVPGSLMSMMGVNSLHQIVREEKITDPAKILHRLDENINKQFSKVDKEKQANDGMDIAIVLYDKKKNKIEYASAMRPLYFISNGELMELKNDVFPIGGNYDEKIFKTREVEIKKGDQLILSTDGYADQFGGPKNKKFLTKKLKLLIQENANLPLDELKEKLLSEFLNWKEANEQVDDVCLMGIKI